MSKFTDRLFGLINEEETSLKFLVEYLDLSDVSVIYTWKREEYYPSTLNVIKISKLYDCSIDYLLGRTDDYGEFSASDMAGFANRLENQIKSKKIKKSILEKEKICSSNNLFKWKKLKSTPTINTLIKLADYFGVSVDYLLGG